MALPTFLVIGAPKCGTTSLFTYLDQHPDVYMSGLKEPRFFASGASVDQAGGRQIIEDLSEYEALFEPGRHHGARGEASTAYLRDPLAPAAVRRLIPDARLIALLRDPVARAYSAWGHLMREGREPIHDFVEAVEAEEARAGTDGFLNLMRYVEAGSYHRQLQAWLEVFPRNQLRVYLSEDLRRDTTEVVRDAFEHIGVDPTFEPVTDTEFNRSGIPRIRWAHGIFRGDVPDSIRAIVRRLTPTAGRRRVVQRLASANLARLPGPDEAAYRRFAPLFRTDISNLRVLLGRDLSEWRTTRILFE